MTLLSVIYRILFLSLFFFLIYSSPILLKILYILLFRQNSLDKPILLILSPILVFYVGINHLSKKRTLSNSTYIGNNSHRMRVFLDSKGEKRRITEIKRIAKLIK